MASGSPPSAGAGGAGDDGGQVAGKAEQLRTGVRLSGGECDCEGDLGVLPSIGGAYAGEQGAAESGDVHSEGVGSVLAEAAAVSLCAPLRVAPGGACGATGGERAYWVPPLRLLVSLACMERK